MIVDLMDMIWLGGTAISIGFLSYGGYLVVTCMSAEEQESLTRARLFRHWRHRPERVSQDAEPAGGA